MVVVDADNGRVVASLPIGRGSDAVAFDPSHKRVFSSNGMDGTVSVYQQSSADKYVLADLITTQVSARTMDLDPKSGRLFVAASDPAPGLPANGRPKMTPGSLKLLIFDPKN